MGRFFETVTDLRAAAETVRLRRYGVIEILGGEFKAIHLRPWPKLVSIFGAILGQRYHQRAQGDRLWLYYNQPRRHSTFLALKFVVSKRNTKWSSMLKALAVLDEIARLKKCDAILCDAANLRFTPRLLAREGWEPHTRSRWHRNYIKRFYGAYSQKRKNRKTQEVLAATV